MTEGLEEQIDPLVTELATMLAACRQGVSEHTVAEEVFPLGVDKLTARKFVSKVVEAVDKDHWQRARKWRSDGKCVLCGEVRGKIQWVPWKYDSETQAQGYVTVCEQCYPSGSATVRYADGSTEKHGSGRMCALCGSAVLIGNWVPRVRVTGKVGGGMVLVCEPCGLYTGLPAGTV